MSPRTIVYPMEITTRELDGVILTALKIAAGGDIVVIGPKLEIEYTVHKLKPDIYISTRANDFTLPVFETVRNIGSHMCIVDAEGAIFFDDFYKLRHHKKSLALIDRFFAAGQAAADILINSGNIDSDRVVASGVPWFDLRELKECYETECRIIDEQFPNSFILYNSSFGNVNPKLERAREQVAQEQAKHYEDAYAHLRITFKGMLDVIERMAQEMPHEQFVVRPHPVEDHTIYHERLGKYPNVHISALYSARNWIISSKMLIHNNSTTGAEAALFGKPVISFVPVQDDRYEMEVHKSSSIRTHNYEELLSAVKEVLEGGTAAELSEKRKQGIGYYFANVHHSASSRIVEVLKELGVKSPRKKPGGRWNRTYYMRYAMFRVIYHFPALLKLLPRKRRQKLLEFKSFALVKFKPFDIALLKLRQAQIARLVPEAASVKIEPLPGYQYSFRFSPK